MRFLTLEDESGLAEAVIFPDVYERDGHRLAEPGVLCVTGVVEDQMGACSLHAERIWPPWMQVNFALLGSSFIRPLVHWKWSAWLSQPLCCVPWKQRFKNLCSVLSCAPRPQPQKLSVQVLPLQVIWKQC